MVHAYTPGLRVSRAALLRRERRLPLKGRVVVELGRSVEPDTIVARTELPGNVQTVNLAVKLAVDPARVAGTLTRPLGSDVQAGEIIASGKTLFGLVQHRAEAPVAGVLESVSTVTGQLIIREPPLPVEVAAYIEGVVADVLPGEGVVIETRGAFIQGIFGVGGETSGAIEIVAASPGDALAASAIRPEHRGKVLVGGAYVSFEAVERAREMGVSALVVGGFDDHDLRALLGRDLGVAITGSESLGLTLVLTEGFGHIPMAERTWKLLGEHAGRRASVSGATQIRAGVIRPEIIVPVAGAPVASEDHGSASGLDIGSLLRVIREPHFGRIGRAVELPPELRTLDSEALVRVLTVEFADDGSRDTVPRANVELIAE